MSDGLVSHLSDNCLEAATFAAKREAELGSLHGMAQHQAMIERLVPFAAAHVPRCRICRNPELRSPASDAAMTGVARLLKAVTVPLIVLNLLGGIVSGIVLAVLGQWRAIGVGIAGLFVRHFVLGFALLPGMLFMVPGNYFQRRGSTAGLAVSLLAGAVYHALVIAVWRTVVLMYFAQFADSTLSLAALLVWSYGFAIAPLQYLASQDRDNEFSYLTTVFAQITYVIVIGLFFVVNVFQVKLVRDLERAAA